MTNTTKTESTQILARLDQIQGQIQLLVERQAAQAELIDEMRPILSEVMKAGTNTLQEMEEKGWFTFARESASILERIVEGYGVDDFRALGDSVVGILDTVKSLTQPEVLAVAHEATEALAHADDVKPVGVMGMLKASRDDDVQYGTALMLEVLRQIGRASRSAASRATDEDKRRHRLAARTSPSRRVARPAARLPAPARSAPARSAPTKGAPSKGAAPAMPEIDPASWTRDAGTAMAASLGIELSDAHWKVIEFARADYAAKSASPNIRRITAGMEINTREIYALFPKAPARTISRISGLPKPAGCI
ncbi:MAG: TusE/DsrC/DsvC family sulfur relay protein [Myxococcales bacterium]|nr:TusE/DsrC/DsvC family sulfur relay protein [Myxococcales bacterium]